VNKTTVFRCWLSDARYYKERVELLFTTPHAGEWFNEIINDETVIKVICGHLKVAFHDDRQFLVSILRREIKKAGYPLYTKVQKPGYKVPYFTRLKRIPSTFKHQFNPERATWNQQVDSAISAEDALYYLRETYGDFIVHPYETGLSLNDGYYPLSLVIPQEHHKYIEAAYKSKVAVEVKSITWLSDIELKEMERSFKLWKSKITDGLLILNDRT
jgi:hypothetical protein